MYSVFPGLRRGNKNQLTSVEFAPTANVAVSKLEKENGTFKLVQPIHGFDLPLSTIDEHE
jgi:hypothetical protein